MTIEEALLHIQQEEEKVKRRQMVLDYQRFFIQAYLQSGCMVVLYSGNRREMRSDFINEAEVVNTAYAFAFNRTLDKHGEL